MNKPNFLIVGAAKAGTTALYDFLSQHPEVYMPHKKECKFFSGLIENKGPGDEYRNQKRTKTWDEYVAFFDAVADQKAIGEATPDYLYYYETSIENIKKYLGNDVKIIIILRNPVDRAYSAYMHNRRDMVEKESFSMALALEKERIEYNYALMWRYRSAGEYFIQVEAYLKVFSNVMVLFHDDLLRQPEDTMSQLFRFLEINDTFLPQFSDLNVSGEPVNWNTRKFLLKNERIKAFKKLIPQSFKRKLRKKVDQRTLEKIKIGADEKAELIEFYKGDILKLSELLSKDLNHWLE